jgi:hypothetical protein
MAKQSGLGMNCYVGGYDLSGDVGSIETIHGGPSPLVVTGIDKGAIERQGGVRDGGVEFTSWFNPAAGAAHPKLSALPTADDIVTITTGTTIGSAAVSQNGKQIGYDPKRGNDGSLAFKVSAQASSYGIEWGNLLTAGIRSDTAPTNGTGFNFLASTSFAWQAYLHVVSVTGTVTVALEDSADNINFAPFAGSAFAAAAAIGAQRIAGVALSTVRQYVRAVTSGAFSQASFAVMFVKNQTAVVF